MSKSEPILCPSCEAEYKVVTIDVCDVQRGKIPCLQCDALFPAGDDGGVVGVGLRAGAAGG